MASVYSTRFLGWASSSLPPAYTVPTGYVAIIRDIDVTTGGGAITNFAAAINGVAKFAVGAFTVESVQQQYSWRGRVVARSGELITFASDVATDGVIGGYLLIDDVGD